MPVFGKFVDHFPSNWIFLLGPIELNDGIAWATLNNNLTHLTILFRRRRGDEDYPQLFSRIGFVHELCALSDADIQTQLDQRWMPVGIHLPASAPAPEVMAAMIRLSPGDFRLLLRPLNPMDVF